jgi:hypothetical protein
MHTYTLKVEGGAECHIDRKGDRFIDIKVGEGSATVNVNDLAMIVKECLPVETAQEMFGHVDEREIQSGKVKLKIKANYDIKAGDYIVTSLDINKYLDKQGKPTGIRTTKSGILF